jgi:hypothetical protein
LKDLDYFSRRPPAELLPNISEMLEAADDSRELLEAADDSAGKLQQMLLRKYIIYILSNY